MNDIEIIKSNMNDIKKAISALKILRIGHQTYQYIQEIDDATNNIMNILTMKSKPIKEITIECSDEDDAMKIGELIHKQLIGNDDYVNNNIVLNCTDFDNLVKIAIFPECKKIPQIII